MAVTQYKPKQYTYQPIQNSAPAGQQASTENQQIRGVSDATRQKQAQYQQGYNGGYYQQNVPPQSVICPRCNGAYSANLANCPYCGLPRQNF